MTQDLTNAQTFEPDRRVQILQGCLLPTILIGAMSIGIYMGVTNENALTDWYIYAIIGLLFASIVYGAISNAFIAFRSKIIIADEGLTVIRGGSRYFTTWDNVEGFGGKRMFRQMIYGVRLSHPVTPVGQGLSNWLTFSRPTRLIGWSNMQPQNGLNVFGIDLDKFSLTDMGQAFYRHIPHVFTRKRGTTH